VLFPIFTSLCVSCERAPEIVNNALVSPGDRQTHDNC